MEVPNETLVAGKRTLGCVDRAEQLPENINTQTRTEFQKKSQRALSTIFLAINTPQLHLVTSYTVYDQPKDARDALRNHLELKTLTNKLFLKKYF